MTSVPFPAARATDVGDKSMEKSDDGAAPVVTVTVAAGDELDPSVATAVTE